MTKTMPHRVLLIGLGQIGMLYDYENASQNFVLTHARAVSFHRSFELSAAVEIDLVRADKFKKKFKAPVFQCLETALKVIQPDVVIIATNSDTHASTLQKVLVFATPKVVLCEKPLALSVEEARLMVDTCTKKNVPLFVNYMRRAEPGALEIRRRIQMGEIKTPLKGACYYSKGLLNNGSHFLNLMEFWLGDILEITLLRKDDTSGVKDPEPDFLVMFSRGQMVFQSAWEEYYTLHTVELVSPSGRLRYEHGGELILWNSVSADGTFPGYFVLGDNVQLVPNAMKKYQLNVMNQLECFLNGENVHLCDARSALETLVNLEKIISKTNDR